MKEATKEIVEELAILSTSEKSGWDKLIARVSWNGNPAKIEIRSWDKDRVKCSKGINFTDAEVEKLKEFFGGK